jgi:membrane-associated phospholipid phosphatase
LRFAARIIHKYGDFEFFVGAIGIFLFFIGKIRSNAYFTRIASTLFLAGVIAGISVQVIKFTLGRPRPPLVQQGKAHAWSFAGPTFSAKHRSYPSGHSTCAATATTVLALALPRLRSFVAVIAVLVAMSRVVYNYHFPTDVLHGLAFGMAVGGMCASHLVLLRKRLVRKGQWPT